jgi:hypothetical protein
MAVINYTLVPYPEPARPIGYLVTWGPMQNGDTGQPCDLPGFADRTIQVEGTLGSGGTVELQGSNDLVNFRVLHDPYSNPLDYTTLRIDHLTEIPALIRPVVLAGDGTTAIVVTMFIRRTDRNVS